ncbi:hypothetical protein [Poseidonibacter ostreae]|jgi:hypothetical protein|uniref:Uncharacterized protein n=1 Tax=Poseidonibacter ostreae TaxID=2654171 RepID=A0A6L4WTL6_9BACT|nr:hypothetical protein [Poseidonibacter ostreae]KAB7887056.1 hypothetical protein GA417_03260 [Poseidonibacter ostreae]KAB7889220.1 hypothetical protein GBG19_06920 [Poseidonibacter ostreae]KAB7891579.1 hypothetical protein GBG18_06320 [Poseidonibacter ostreae]MAC84089.1 hypothetical protein [Arcobacter sp.]|tara:strand:+ start:1416 stop:1832 length:417 start_codon:yes stop_codon:yes gene_type:complete
MFNTIEEIIFSSILVLFFIYLIIVMGSKGVKVILASVNASAGGVLGNGEKIGKLERLLYFAGVITQNWILISLIIGLKTISRFQKLNKQKRAEYFLIGSLSSLLYSIIIGYLFLGAIKLFEFNYLINILNIVHSLNIV